MLLDIGSIMKNSYIGNPLAVIFSEKHELAGKARICPIASSNDYKPQNIITLF